MPPQRRKIVPPTTTSKVRKKVAGSTRKSASAPDTESTDTAQATGATEATEATDTTEATGATEATGTTSNTEVADTTETSGDVEASETPDPSEAHSPVSLDKNTGDEVSGESDTNERSRSSWMPAIVVGAVALVLIAFATVAAIKPGTSVDNLAWVDQGATTEVTNAATEGLTALYAYNWETIDDDLENARNYMGPDLLAETDQFLEAIKSGAEQTQTATEVDVMDIGPIRVESDRAELLANINVSSTRAGVAYDSVMFPIVVNMEKIDDRWVVTATELK